MWVFFLCRLLCRDAISRSLAGRERGVGGVRSERASVAGFGGLSEMLYRGPALRQPGDCPASYHLTPDLTALVQMATLQTAEVTRPR